MRRTGALAGIAGLLGLAAATAGCVSPPPPPPPQARQDSCPTGQESRRMAELFFGHRDSDTPVVSEADFRTFVDKEVTRRFPEGLTVMDGGGRWEGDENRLIREAAKIVLIVLPKSRDARGRVEAVRTAYRIRFHQDSVLVITEAACVAF